MQQPSHFIAVLVALSAALGTVAGLSFGDVGRPAAGPAAPPPRRAARPLVPPPPPPPAELINVAPDDARAINAARPFSGETPRAAAPFSFAGTPADRAVAETCLAAAVLYEAGDDRPGQQAVAQVVLNRLRHPSYPKTVCGVVFQGSERRTGCQFTFTCDGALARAPHRPAWDRARRVAVDALSGFVYKPVGSATHYHTDWVVPYWQGSLVKLTSVHTHIFYRWGGFRASARSLGPIAERLPRKLVGVTPDLDATQLALADESEGGGEWEPVPARATGSQSIAGVPDSALRGNVVFLKDEATAHYVLELVSEAQPGGWAVVGYSICGGRPSCTVMGWTRRREMPASIPVPALKMKSVAFIYRSDPALTMPQMLWDCGRYPRADRSQCIQG